MSKVVEHVEMNVNVGGDFKTIHPITNTKAVLLEEGKSLFEFMDGMTPMRVDENGNLSRKLPNGSWALVNVNAGIQLTLGDVSSLSVTTLNNRVAIRWNDPVDIVLTTDAGSKLPLAEWAGTKVVMKKGSEPSSHEDGDLIEDVKVKDKYSSSGLVVDGLVAGDIYHVKLFPYTTKGLYTSNSSNNASVKIGYTPLGPVTGLMVGSAGSKAYITWSDPMDVDIEFNGETVPASKWAGTNVIMKPGSYPTDSSDGQLVATTTVRDKYAADSLEIRGLQDGITYFFALFPYNEQHVESFDAVNRGATTVRFGELSTVSDLKVVSASNTVSLNWKDPANVSKYVNGEEVTSVEWKSTVVIRKEGSVPSSINDGVMVKESLARNEHEKNPLIDTNLKRGTTYYYKLFSISTDGKATTGQGNVAYVDIPTM